MATIAQCAVCRMAIAHGWQYGQPAEKTLQGKIAALKIRLTVEIPAGVHSHTDDATGRERMTVGEIIGHDTVQRVKHHPGIALDMGDGDWPLCRLHARDTNVSQAERLQPTSLPVSLTHETDRLTGERVRLHVLHKRNRPIAVDKDADLDTWLNEYAPTIGRLDDTAAPPITAALTQADRAHTRTFLQATDGLHTVQRLPMGYAENMDHVRKAEAREAREKAKADRDARLNRALAQLRAKRNPR